MKPLRKLFLSTSRIIRWGLVIPLAIASAAFAKDVMWDGKTYIPVGLRLGSDFALTLPEPVYTSPESKEAFEQTDFSDGGRTFMIRPKQAIEQRVFFQGANTGTIYIARFSPAVPYDPVINVVLAATPAKQVEATPAKLGPRSSLTTLMRAMMQSALPTGFERSKANTVLIDAGAFRIVAKEVWSDRAVTAITVAIVKDKDTPSVTVHPADIQITVPELGPLRIFGADRWELSEDTPASVGYLIFER